MVSHQALLKLNNHTTNLPQSYLVIIFGNIPLA